MTERLRKALTGADWFGLALITSFLYMIYITTNLKGYFANDLSAFYAAGLAIANGMPDAIYDRDMQKLVIGTPERIRSLLAEAGLPSDKTPPYLYPPIWAYLMAPFTRVLPMQVFFDVMIGVQSFMLAMMPWVGYRIARPSQLKAPIWLILAFLLLFISTITLSAIAQNQLQISVAFVTLLSMLALARRKSKTAGVLLGLAAALKIAPAAFGLLFLMRRDWRAIGALAVTGGVLLCVSLLVGGLPLHLTMLERLADINSATILSRVNFSPEMVLYELRRVALGIAPDLPRLGTFAVFDAPGWIQVLPKLCLIASFGWIVVAHLRRTAALGTEVLVMSLAMALFGPLSWTHYFLLPFALTPVIFSLFKPRTAWIWVILGSAVTSTMMIAWLNPKNADVMISPMPGTFYFLIFTGAVLIRASLSNSREGKIPEESSA